MKQIIECPECGKPIIATVVGNDTKLANVEGVSDKVIYWKHEGCSHGSSMDPEDINILKAISIQQPWAWLIIRPDLECEAREKARESGEIKDIENRRTLKNLKGKYLIHTGIKPDWKGYFQHLHNNAMMDIVPNEGIKMGGIIGWAEFDGSVQESDSPWFAGPNGLVIKNAGKLDFIPCKGMQGVFYPKID